MDNQIFNLQRFLPREITIGQLKNQIFSIVEKQMKMILQLSLRLKKATHPLTYTTVLERQKPQNHIFAGRQHHKSN